MPASQISLTCCRFSTFLGVDNESSHSFHDPDQFSLNTAIVAGSIEDADVACVACTDEVRTSEAKVDGLMPDAVEMGKAGLLNEEGMMLVEGYWVVDDWMEGVRYVVGAA